MVVIGNADHFSIRMRPAGPPTQLAANRPFGRERVGIMFGWIVASHQVGAALAAWAAGWVRTVEGAYDRAFLISGGLCVLTAGMVLLIGQGRPSGSPSGPAIPDAA